MLNPDAWFDFNDARTRFSTSQENGFDVERIKARLLDNIEGVLAYLLPAGKIRYGKFYVGDVAGQSGDSMVLELIGPKAGMWFDHATGQGGDIIDLWAATRGWETKRDFSNILQEISVWLGEMPTTSRNRPNRKSPPVDELGFHTGKWDYHDRDGNLVACVYRYDPPSGKEFRPWDACARRWQAPDPRPLFNLPAVLASSMVILVEGEKCAQALQSLGIVASTAMHGANAPVDKTDWSPLAGKEVLIWPDKDAPGWNHAVAMANACQQTGCRSVAILSPPDDKPEKWDAADAVAEGINIPAFLAAAERQEIRRRDPSRFNLLAWTYDRYLGPPPERRWLVRDVLPLAVPGMVAAIGGAGKSMLLLDLAVKTASVMPGKFPPSALGGIFEPETGTAVMLTAEDDKAEVHRRLHGLAPQLTQHSRLIVLPLPNAGGPASLVSAGRDGPVLTREFDDLRQELAMIPNLRLLVLDPLQSFVGADVNADPAVGNMFFAALGRIAAETGATVLATHHFRKTGNRPILTAQDARDAIRGTTALVDSGRWSYALWTPEDDEAKKICQQLGLRFERDSVFLGAIVKSNWPTDKTVRVFVRDSLSGLLMDRTTSLHHLSGGREGMLVALETAIAKGAANGQPFTRTGGSGLYERRSELPDALANMTRSRLLEMAETLLGSGQIVLCMAGDSKLKKWLDVPNGEFALGVGRFQIGASPLDEP
ncbi:MAG: AAA family ATPase [Magnetococcales bacterium]|nr:AAA family ATPase [Magnetococcales bacterium]